MILTTPLLGEGGVYTIKRNKFLRPLKSFLDLAHFPTRLPLTRLDACYLIYRTTEKGRPRNLTRLSRTVEAPWDFWPSRLRDFCRKECDDDRECLLGHRHRNYPWCDPTGLPPTWRVPPTFLSHKQRQELVYSVR